MSRYAGKEHRQTEHFVRKMIELDTNRMDNLSVQSTAAAAAAAACLLGAMHSSMPSKPYTQHPSLSLAPHR